MQTSTLRPGLLVALSTTITGNVSYKRRDIVPEHVTEGGAKEATWQTDKTVFDATEDERATEVRSKVRSLITGVCSRFGDSILLCPQANAAQLDAAIAEARKLADDFNATATLSRVSVTVFTGEIAQDDVTAVQKINAEVRKLIDAMADGVNNLDAERVREAANKARALSGMLSDGAQERVAVAIKTAREAARKITKAGEQAAQEIDTATVRKIAEARTAFLDLDVAPVDVATPDVEQRGLDLAPQTEQPRGVLQNWEDRVPRFDI